MQKKRPFEAQIMQLSLISSVPLLLLLLWVMTYADISIWIILLTALIGSVLIVYNNSRIYQKSVSQFRSVNHLLDALIQGDYALRARTGRTSGAQDELVDSINRLATRLSQQRSESVESQLLAHTVIEHIDVAIVALDLNNEISFLNPAAQKLLHLDKSNSNPDLGNQLNFVQSFSSGHHQVVELTFGHQHGRFNVHIEEFRESGIQHKLLFVTDVRTLLRSEERKAWQSLVRVISHEINNSLSPIASISQTLTRLIERQDKQTQTNKDLIDGLTIITERANALSQFVESYKQLAKLPEPKKQQVSVLKLCQNICMLFKHQSIVVKSEADFQLYIDPVQFEQVLINLLKNAVESMSQTNPEGIIEIKWQVDDPVFRLTIRDHGSGINNPDNLFVPFYTTKKNGSGVGLVLCRQIIEAHNGRLTIINKESPKGCCACIEIPLTQE